MRNHATISRQHRFDAIFTHSFYNLLLKFFLTGIPTFRIRSSPPFQIIHQPPSCKTRSGYKFINFILSISPVLEVHFLQTDSVPVQCQGKIDTVKRHPIYLLFPTLPVPKKPWNKRKYNNSDHNDRADPFHAVPFLVTGGKTAGSFAVIPFQERCMPA